MKIRPFEITDFEDVVSLWVEAGLEFKPTGRDTPSRVKNLSQKENAVFLVAEDAGRIVGSVFGTHDGRKGWINRIAVAPDYRRAGLGCQLVQEVEKRLEPMDIVMFAGLVDADNLPSISMFIKCGYTRHDDIIYFTKKKHPGA